MGAAQEKWPGKPEPDRNEEPPRTAKKKTRRNLVQRLKKQGIVVRGISGSFGRAHGRAIQITEAASPKAAVRAQAAAERGLPAPFLADFIGEAGAIESDRIGQRFGFTKMQVAETAGLAREALYRPHREAAPSTQARLAEMLEIVGRDRDWAGGDLQAMAWYRAEPLPPFGGRTAESLVKEGAAAAVRDFLDHVARGGYA